MLLNIVTFFLTLCTERILLLHHLAFICVCTFGKGTYFFLAYGRAGINLLKKQPEFKVLLYLLLVKMFGIWKAYIY